MARKKAVAKTNTNALAVVDKLRAGLEHVQKFAAQAAQSETYLRMAKEGYWHHGTDEVEVEDDAEWAVNPFSFATGFSAFDDNSNRVGEEMRLLSEPPIGMAELPVVNGRWHQQINFTVKCLSGEDEGLEAIVSVRAKGGLRAAQDLLDELLAKLDTGTEDVVPIIALDTTHYRHKQYGRIYQPVFTILDWTVIDDDAEIPEPEEETPDVIEAEKPRRRTKATPQPEEVEEVEEAEYSSVDDEDEDDEPEPVKPSTRRKKATPPAQPEDDEDEDDEEAAPPRSTRRKKAAPAGTSRRAAAPPKATTRRKNR